MSVDTSRVADSNTTAATAHAPSVVGAAAEWADDRLGLAALAKKNLRKVFPDHWSFMLGEIALWSFVVLLLSGVFLTLWYTPSMGETTYEGPYSQLRGIQMSEAYASTLKLSFEVRGGLLMRQIHHWAAMLFIGAMMLHMMRVYFTGAHRKPREINWVIGAMLLLIGTLEGFTGYSLPDDLLSGTGIRAASGFMTSIPIVGTYVDFFLFGGEFPGTSIIPRLYVIHILLIPGALLGLITAHMLLLVYLKHTQWAGPGRTNDNVVGYPMLPVYAAKAGGFFFIVFGVTAAMGGLLTLNPVWKFGPYDPSKVTAGSQPDWYMGWPDGLLRIMPNIEFHFWHHTWAFNVFFPIIVMPGVMFTLVLMLPFIENWITGDKRDHHILQRPRDAPTRTAFMVGLIVFYGISWMASGNDIIAIRLHMSINQITYFNRAAIFIGPVVAFVIARRWAISLQRKDNEDLLHGYETGIIMRSPEGGYSERHAPLSPERAYALAARDPDPTMPALEASSDENGIEPRHARIEAVRNRLRRYMYEDNVQPPTPAELEAAHHHAEHELALQQPMDGHSADGHQFDGHHDVDENLLSADD